MIGTIKCFNIIQSDISNFRLNFLMDGSQILRFKMYCPILTFTSTFNFILRTSWDEVASTFTLAAKSIEEMIRNICLYDS